MHEGTKTKNERTINSNKLYLLWLTKASMMIGSPPSPQLDITHPHLEGIKQPLINVSIFHLPL